MNIIFEGISGCGKTTTINELCKQLDTKKIQYEKIGDLEYDTPIKDTLIDMVTKAPLMNDNASFKTSIYESLLIAANQHYIQEKLRNENKICVYDRDFISALAYQKEILKKDYKDWKKIYKIYRDLILFDLKEIDYLVYLIIPFEEAIARTEKRDNRKFSVEDIEMLKSIKKNIEKELSIFDNGSNVIYLDGTKPAEENVKKLLYRIGDK